MMDYLKFVQSHTVKGSGESKPPSTRKYFWVQVIDNGLAIAVFILCVLFGLIGLFVDAAEDRVSWALHAAELCLGVLLGLLAKGRAK